MPVHRWTRIFSGGFHHFHTGWITRIGDELNNGLLPPEFYAAAEQVAGHRNPDVIALERSESVVESGQPSTAGGVLVAEAPPRVSYEFIADSAEYAARANRIAVRHVSSDRIVSIIEVVSPGNKHSHPALEQLRNKVAAMIESGIHLLIVDLIPPNAINPDGLPRALEIERNELIPSVTTEQPFSLCSLQIEHPVHGYVELCGVGETLPEMPLFLTPERYISLPLEHSYMATWNAFPAAWKKIVLGTKEGSHDS